MKRNFSSRMSPYLHSLSFYILLISFLFAFSIALGYAGFLSEVSSEQIERTQELSSTIKEFTQPYPLFISFLIFFGMIFLKNSFTCFLNIILGTIIGIFPLLSTFINGSLIGFLAKDIGLIVIFGILPHGIFEIPAFLLSAAVGLRIAREVLKRKGERSLLGEFRKGFHLFLLLILPLLLLAAIIESFLIVITL